MGAFTNKHPLELTQAVGEAIANGATAAQVHRDLTAGTFNAWNGPYDMPLETVRSYGKKERARRSAKTITPEVRDSPKKVVDHLARLLLSKAQRGAEAASNDDPKALKDWGDAIKTINALVSDTARPEPKNGRSAKPKDALTARLTGPSLPLAAEDKTQGDRERASAPQNANGSTNTDHDNTAPLGGVLLQPPVHAPSWGQ